MGKSSLSWCESESRGWKDLRAQADHLFTPQVRRRRPREVKGSAEGHAAVAQHSWNETQGFLLVFLCSFPSHQNPGAGWMGRGRGFTLVPRANSSFGKLLVDVVFHSLVSGGCSCPAPATSSWKVSGALGTVRGWSHLPVSSPNRG